MSKWRSFDIIAPVAIGGLGGSGTRLAAQIFMALNYDLGSDLNEATDNLWFTLLFRRQAALNCTPAELDACSSIFQKAMLHQGSLSDQERLTLFEIASQQEGKFRLGWVSRRTKSLIDAAANTTARPFYWGWKEPNTHIVLPRLVDSLPHLHYVHIIRNGLDMAYSANQNQLRMWGRHVLGPRAENTPYYSLKYWVAVHRRMRSLAARMGRRLLFVNFDRLCSNPREELERLLLFVDIKLPSRRIVELERLVVKPQSVGRFRRFDANQFDPADVAFVRELGFEVE